MKVSDELLRADAALAKVEGLLPAYPDALFEMLMRELDLSPNPLVVDLGAGTGRASLVMARLGWHVIAVDTDGQALSVLRVRAERNVLNVTTVEAKAESTGVGDASADLVVASHSFHWFDSRMAVAEIARITRPSGGVALFWNVRDRERSPFIADYNRVLDRFGVSQDLYLEADQASGRAARDALTDVTGFSQARLVELRHEMAMNSDDFVRLALSAPYARAFAPGTRTAFRKQVEQLLTAHGHAIGESFQLPYRITCWIASRVLSDL